MKRNPIIASLLALVIMTIVIVQPCYAISNIASVSLGSGDSMFVIQNDGTVWSTGHDFEGTLGDGTTTDRCVLGSTLIDNASKIVVVDGGMALKKDGTVWTWGTNRYGIRGYETSDNLIPAPIPNMTGVKDIAGYNDHCYAIKKDGSVWAWGTNYRGVLGDGTDTTRITPVQIQGLPNNIVSIATGGHTLALDSDGHVWAWGSDSFGQLGDGQSDTSSYTPKKISIDNVKKIAVDGLYSYAIKNDNTLWRWGVGYNSISDPYVYSSTPVQVSDISDVVSIAPGRGTLALKSDGSVWGWGVGLITLGNGVTDLSSVIDKPQKVNIDNVAAIYVGNGDYVAMKKDGSLWAWGFNSWGELGVGRVDDSSKYALNGVFTPMKVLDPGATPLPPAPTLVFPSPTNTDNSSINQSANQSANQSYNQSIVTLLASPSPTAVGSATSEPSGVVTTHLASPTATNTNNSSMFGNWLLNIVMAVIIMVVIVGGAVYLLVFRNR